MDKVLEKRMYFFTIYQLSGIQAGIQCGHAALEYAYKYKDDPDYIDFIENWKTWIILNGGTTNNDNINLGSLNEIRLSLIDHGIKFSEFYEPDLNNSLTAICFLLDERVFNFRDIDLYNSDAIERLGVDNLFLYLLIRGKSLAKN